MLHDVSIKDLCFYFQSLERCQSLMLQIKQHHCERRERVLKENVVRSLANSLQDIKNEFLRSCSAYTSSKNN